MRAELVPRVPGAWHSKGKIIHTHWIYDQMTTAEAYPLDPVTVRLPIEKEEESRLLAIMLFMGNVGSLGVVSAVVVNTGL
jgi:hypothetical protein